MQDIESLINLIYEESRDIGFGYLVRDGREVGFIDKQGNEYLGYMRATVTPLYVSMFGRDGNGYKNVIAFSNGKIIKIERKDISVVNHSQIGYKIVEVVDKGADSETTLYNAETAEEIIKCNAYNLEYRPADIFIFSMKLDDKSEKVITKDLKLIDLKEAIKDYYGEYRVVKGWYELASGDRLNKYGQTY